MSRIEPTQSMTTYATGTIHCINCGSADVQAYGRCPNCGFATLLCKKCGTQFIAKAV